MNRRFHDMPVSQEVREAMEAEMHRDSMAGAQAAAFIVVAAVMGLAFLAGAIVGVLIG